MESGMIASYTGRGENTLKVQEARTNASFVPDPRTLTHSHVACDKQNYEVMTTK